MRGKWVLAGLVLSVLGSSEAAAAGFAVAEQGAQSLGVAGAATGRIDGADVGFYNPAAIALNTATISAGVSLVMPSIEHQDAQLTQALTNNETPPWVHVGAGIGVNENLRLGGALTFGVPFGARLDWPTTWAGRFEVTSIELRVFETNASFGAAWMQDDWALGLSAGPRLLLGTVGLERKVDVVDDQGEVKLTGDANTWGFQASLAGHYRALSFGLNYRSRATLDYEGNADFAGIPLELSGAIRDQGVTTSVTLPDRIAAGVAYDFGVGVASLDAEVFLWSTFEVFGIDFEREETPDVFEPREWTNTVALRAGWDHRIWQGIRGRAGLAWDPTPSPTNTLSPTLPDSDRFVLALGAGYTYAPWGLGVDLAYNRVVITENTATGDAFAGTYRGGANIFAFGLNYTR